MPESTNNGIMICVDRFGFWCCLCGFFVLHLSETGVYIFADDVFLFMTQYFLNPLLWHAGWGWAGGGLWSGPRGLSDRDQASCVQHSDSTICQVDGDTNIENADTNSLSEDQFLATPILDLRSCLLSKNVFLLMTVKMVLSFRHCFLFT